MLLLSTGSQPGPAHFAASIRHQREEVSERPVGQHSLRPSSALCLAYARAQLGNTAEGIVAAAFASQFALNL